MVSVFSERNGDIRNTLKVKILNFTEEYREKPEKSPPYELQIKRGR
jgi:hypothetical protein